LKKPVPNFCLLLLIFYFLQSCTDPVESEFKFVSNLVYIDGLASTEPNSSFVKISQGIYEFGFYRNIEETGATVSFENMVTGELIILEEQVDAYVPPIDFKVSVGESWRVNVALQDGRKYRSEPETVVL